MRSSPPPPLVLSGGGGFGLLLLLVLVSSGRGSDGWDGTVVVGRGVGAAGGGVDCDAVVGTTGVLLLVGFVLCAVEGGLLTIGGFAVAVVVVVLLLGGTALVTPLLALLGSSLTATLVFFLVI
jgi:hypothetical protein